MARSPRRTSDKKRARPARGARVAVSASAKLAEVEREEANRARAWRRTVEADRTRRRQLAQSLEGKLYLALEAMQDRVAALGHRVPTLATRRPESTADSEYEAGVQVTTDARGGGDGTKQNRRNWRGGFVWRSPWALVGRFGFRSRDIGYADLHNILTSWASRDIERRINGDRFARIRVEYADANSGESGEYTLAETFAWQYGIRRAIAECDPSRSRSLATRYKESVITGIVIWLSSSTQDDQTTFVRRR